MGVQGGKGKAGRGERAVEERRLAEKLSDIYDDEERSTGMEEEKLAFFKQVNWAKDIGCEKGI